MSGEYIQTYGGNRFFFDNPERNVIDLADIAISLARIPRFTCHTTRVYTVAEHAIAVALECYVRHLRSEAPAVEARAAALVGLHHDDAEAYLGDVSAPLKAWLGLGDKLKPIEHAVEEAIIGKHIQSEAARQWIHRDYVKPADLRLLRWESEHMLPGGRRDEWPVLEGVEMPAIDMGRLLNQMPPSKRFAFHSIHETLIKGERLPLWARVAPELDNG